MDLDALLARRPQLVLVDELAHTNAPGSRHPKRYLDVEELLAAGIDVYTTLNIQHVESLNDVVAQHHPHPGARDGAGFDHRAGRRYRADRPDAGRPDPAAEGRQGLCPDAGGARRAPLLLARQSDGAARAGAAAHRAARGRPDGRLHAQAHAIDGPWAAGERVLVCVSGGPQAVADVVRHAKRLADQLRAPWTAIHVETARATWACGRSSDSVVAERCGWPSGWAAETVTHPGSGRGGHDRSTMRGPTTSPIIIVGKSDRRARGGSCCGARSRSG